MEQKEKNEAKARRLEEKYNAEQEAREAEKEWSEQEKRLYQIVNAGCFLVYFLCIGGINSKAAKVIGIGGMVLHGILMGYFRRQQKQKAGMVVCGLVALLILAVSLVLA